MVPCTGPGGGTAGLIAAITAANAAGSGTIRVSPGCTYTLTTVQDQADGGTGLPVLRGAITIHGGPGATIARSNAPEIPAFRVLSVAKGASVSLVGLTITGGHPSGENSQGGAVYNEGTIALLNNDVIRGNSASTGGGIFNLGKIAKLDNSILSGNTAANGGAIFNLGKVIHANEDTIWSNMAGIGGGVSNGGTIADLANSTIAGNRLVSTLITNGAGGGIANSFGTVVMRDDVVSGNMATSGPLASGGGIESSGSFKLFGSVVRGNVAMGVGGGIKNEAQVDKRFAFVVSSSSVIGNTVTSQEGPANGGGISNEGQIAVRGSSVLGNVVRAAKGRAVGGGIYNAGKLVARKSSVGGNTASAPLGHAEGGGIYVDEGSSESALIRVSVAGNDATGAHPRGGGIYFGGGTAITMTRTAVGGNLPQNCSPPGRVPGCHG